MVSISTTHHLDGGWCLEDGLDAVDVNREASVGGGGGAAEDVEDEDVTEDVPEEVTVEEADDPTNDRTNE